MREACQRLVASVVLVSVFVWTLGVGSFFPANMVRAAITVNGPAELIPGQGMHVPANSFELPILRFALTQSASETLSSVTVTIANNTGGSVSDNTLSSHLKQLFVFRDSNNNGNFDPGTDQMAGSTNNVNVTSSTVITVSSNNSLATSGSLPTAFFVLIKTGTAWAGNDAFKVNMPANSIATSANSPTVSAFTGANSVDARTQEGGGMGGFAVRQVLFVNATTIDVSFTDDLDLNSGVATSTANYTLVTADTGDNSAVTQVTLLPDNRSVRVVANGAVIVSNGSDTIAVSNSVKNKFGISNAATNANPIFSGFRPLVISEIKVGSGSDQYDEFVEIYNRSSSDFTATSTLKLHVVNAAGTIDMNVPLVWLATSTGSGAKIAARGYLLVAPVTSPASSTADAVYTTSSIMSLVSDGAVYISNSTASSTAVIDKVCWGSHSPNSDCEGQAAASLGNDGGSLERKANNSSTASTMGLGGVDASNGNGMDTHNNSFDFVTRSIPQPQRSGNGIETPGGGSFGGAGNNAPNIQHAPVFRATTSSAFTLVARMSDDGGELGADKTLLIFCTDNTGTCSPASTTPLYGTSIGAGWFKFSSSSLDWSNGKSNFRYYLQATDNATPAKTKVFTKDPNFDTVTFDTSSTGIQTAALQASKALNITIAFGNLGSASLSGTVKDSSGTGIGNATVWIEGTQFSVTTGNDGSFSFSNVGPTGGYKLRVSKESYVDQALSIFIPSSGLVSLGTITLFSGNMGQGGDFNAPKVKFTMPPQGDNFFPTQGPGGGAPTMGVEFTKTMDATTITDSDASDSGSNVYLTEAGSNTKIAGSVALSNNTRVIFTPAAALTVGKSYILFITRGVKDSAGNPIETNDSSGVYMLRFSTAGQFFENTNQIGSGGFTFGQGQAFPPYIQGSQPTPGKINVPLNSKLFVTFSEGMKNTSDNLSFVKLYQVTSPNTASESKSLVTTSNSLDATGKIVILAPSANLTANKSYRIEVTGGITSAKGIPLGNPGQSGFATTVFYKSDFTTGSATDTTKPTVNTTIPAADATSVSPSKPIVISFSEAMNPSTITESSITLNLGSGSVTGQLSYDPVTWKASFIPDYALTPTSTYTIVVTTDAQDLSGNSFDQDTLVADNQSLQRTFTTGSPDLSSPTVISAEGSDFGGKIKFSKPMLAVAASDGNYTSSVLNPSNYIIRVVNSAGVTQSTVTLPATATVTYLPGDRAVTISGFPVIAGFSAGSTLLNIKVSNVKDISFNSIDTNANAATSTAKSSSEAGNFSGGGFGGGGGPMKDAGGNIIQGGSFGGGPQTFSGFSGSGIGFIPGVKVFPRTPLAGATSVYEIEIPLSKQIPASGYIEITMPDGFDVSTAAKDTNSPRNSDINGPGTGTVVFATSEGTLPTGYVTGGVASDGIIVNTESRVIRLILGAVATRSENSDTHDFLRFDISGVLNSTIADSTETAGNTASVETKKGDGTTLETFTSNPIFLRSTGSFLLRGRVLSGATGVNSVTVNLFSPMTGAFTTTTANSRFGGQDGEFMFQNLLDGHYMLATDQNINIGGTKYSAGGFQPVDINSNSCPSNTCGSRTLNVFDANTGALVTLSISGTFSNDAIDIFAGGQNGFRKATSTLNGVLTNDTSNSIRLNGNGSWMVGFGPAMKEGFGIGGPSAPTSWIPPKPKEVLVTGCPAACVANPTTIRFTSAVANKTIVGIVEDVSGNNIGDAEVFAYSPQAAVGNRTNASADGTFSLNLPYGTFKIGAFVHGMPSGNERLITIKDVSGTDKVFIDGSTTGITLSSMTASQLKLILKKPSLSISGKVTDGTNPVAGAPVFAYRTDGPGHADTFTDSSGNYTIYVDNGTWKVKAVIPQYGELPELTLTVSGSSLSSKNFEPNTSATTFATVIKNILLDTNGDGSFSPGTDQKLSNAQVTVKGTTGDINNDGDTSDAGENVSYLNTATTDTNGSSTLKLPPGTYTLKAWDPVIGDLPAFDQTLIVNSAGTVTQQPSDLLAPATSTLVIKIVDSEGSATTTDKAVIEFQQLGGITSSVVEFDGVASTTISLPKYDAGSNSVALGNVTSTSPGNFYLFQVKIPGISSADLMVYGETSNTIVATSTLLTGYWKFENDGDETIIIRLPEVNYVSGTVTDEDGNAVADATVHIENKTSGETMEIKADSSGNYSTKLSDGNYLFQSNKATYLDTATTVAVTASGTIAAAATKMDLFDYTITGTITADSSAAVGATVRAERLGGGVVTATTDTDGSYILRVIAGDWKVSATAEGYTEKAYTGGVLAVSGNKTGISINLTATNSNLAGTTSLTVTPQTGGVLSDGTAGLDIVAPGSSLSSSQDSQPLTDKEVSNVVGGGSGSPIGGEAKEIKSYDSDGNNLTTLNDDISIRTTHATTDLDDTLGNLTIANTQKVKVGSFDTTSDNWEHLVTTVAYRSSSSTFVEPNSSLSNVSNISYTGQTVHLSVFNPLVSSDGLAPSAPTGVSGSFGSGGSTVIWTAPTTNADGSSLSDLLGYEIYRSTSANGTYTQINSSDITGTSYTDTGAVAGNTYFYKVTAADTGGLESAMSSASSGVTPSSGGGQNLSGGSGGGGGGGGGDTAAQKAPVLGNPAVMVVGVTASSTVSSYTVTFNFNVTNATQVQISEASDFRGSDWDAYVSSKRFILSRGNGAKKVYVKFRSAFGEVSTVQIVDLILETNEVAPPAAAVPQPAIKPQPDSKQTEKKPVAKPAPIVFRFTLTLKSGSTGEAVRQLQLKLQELGYLDKKIKANGSFGPATLAAVRKLQLKLKIKENGVVGPITRAVLNGETSIINRPAPTEPVIVKKSAPIVFRFTLTLKSGSTGEAVRQLQLKLQELGYLDKKIKANGSFGPATLAAVRKLQLKLKIKENGVVGEHTRAILNDELTPEKIEPVTLPTETSSGTKDPSVAFHQELRRGMTGSDVARLQRKLQELGYLDAKTKANGIFGPATLAAVRRLQAAYQINENGVIGVKTRSALNGELAAPESSVSEAREVVTNKEKLFRFDGVATTESDLLFDESSVVRVQSNVRLPFILKLNYSYANTTEAVLAIGMARELLNETGKVLDRKTGRWTVEAGSEQSQEFTQPVAGNLPLGAYTIRLRATDQNGKLLAENKTYFSVVEKE